MDKREQMQNAFTPEQPTGPTTYKATFNIERQGTINVKPKWYKKAQAQEISVNDKVVLGGLTKDESEECHNPFTQKLVGLFVGGVVTSCKVEEETSNG